MRKYFTIQYLGLLIATGVASQANAQGVPPYHCNTDAARIYMVEHVAHQLFIAPKKIAAIGTLGGAGGDSGAIGNPADKDYSSQMSCPIRVTLVGGGKLYMTYNERYSNLYNEEVSFTPFAGDPSDPLLKWFDTQNRDY